MKTILLKYENTFDFLEDAMKNSETEQYQDAFHSFVNLRLEDPINGLGSGPAKVYNLDSEKDKCKTLLKECKVWDGVKHYDKARGWDSLRVEDHTKKIASIQAKLSNSKNIDKDMSVSVLGDGWSDMCLMSQGVSHHIVATTYSDLTKRIDKRGYPFNPVILGYDYWMPQTEIQIKHDKQWWKAIKNQIKKRKVIKRSAKIVLDEDQIDYVNYGISSIEQQLALKGVAKITRLANGGFGKTVSDGQTSIDLIKKLWDGKIYG